MRLTNSIRDAFVSSAMHDVPVVKVQEEAQKIIMQAAIKGLPPKVKAVYDDPSTRHFLQSQYVQYSSIPIPQDLRNKYGNYNNIYQTAFGSINVPGPQNSIQFTKEEVDKLTELARRHHSQAETTGTLRQKLRNVAYSVSTRKALADLLPEFSKYLPPEIPTGSSSRYVPAVTDVLTEFVRAGWPSREAETQTGTQVT